MVIITKFWDKLLIGESNYDFLPDVGFRTLIMFLILLLVLRMIGKRGIRQLSIFELALIISLGSAAGDPMIYEEVGILPALLVFLVIISLYKAILYLSGKSERIEKFVEGQPRLLVKQGEALFEQFKSESYSRDELFAQLREKHVDQLGQVQYAFLETSGDLSIIFFPTNETKWGLPILPEFIDKNMGTNQEKSGSIIACAECGKVQKLLKNTSPILCQVCGKSEWKLASSHTRNG